jgi:hypothetical protein
MFCSPREPTVRPKSVQTANPECHTKRPNREESPESTQRQTLFSSTPAQSPSLERDIDSLKSEVQRLIDRVQKTAKTNDPTSLPQRSDGKKPNDRSPLLKTKVMTKRMEQENIELKSELAAMQKLFDESQNEIAALRKALAKNEAKREKRGARNERFVRRSLK